jgi:hypothetical protein
MPIGAYSHDAILHAVLYLLEVETDIYHPSLGLMSRSKRPAIEAKIF